MSRAFRLATLQGVWASQLSTPDPAPGPRDSFAGYRALLQQEQRGRAPFWGVIEARPAAVAELFDRYSPVVRRLPVRTLGSACDVDDLIQETFLASDPARLYSARDPSAFQSFVGSFAIRLAKNELRRRALRRFSLGELEETHWVHGDPLAREGLQRLHRALARLDSTSRILFVLRHVEELELTEIAQIERVSLATIKRRIARAERAFEAVAQADPVLRDYLERAR